MMMWCLKLRVWEHLEKEDKEAMFLNIDQLFSSSKEAVGLLQVESTDR
jgi:hypothetical protein